MTGRLKCGAVRLLCGKVDALLLLCRPQRLPIASIQDIGIRLRVGQVLLIGKVRLGNAGSVATKGTSLDRLPLEAGRLLCILHVLARQGGVVDAPQVWRHELTDLLTADLLGVHRLPASEGERGSGG